VASAYGALINNKQSWKRYSTIFDDGYFKDAAAYLTSGVAGAIGGPMGMIGHKVDLSHCIVLKLIYLWTVEERSYFLYWQK
jgi:hypothetical protein